MNPHLVTGHQFGSDKEEQKKGEREEPRAWKVKINCMKYFNYACNGRSVQEADKTAGGGHRGLRSKARDLPKPSNELFKDCDGPYF